MTSEMITKSANTIEPDASVSWEDFFGSSTDLVPQLLGMFDELARKDEVNNRGDKLQMPIQKHFSLVAPHSHHNTIYGQICGAGYSAESTMPESKIPDATAAEVTVAPDKMTNAAARCDEKNKYVNGVRTEQAATCRDKKIMDRPLSGSSIASSTSSSGCSNQENVASGYPYLASAESLADTCVSAQSLSHGVEVRSSDEANGLARDNAGQRKKFAADDLTTKFRNTVERVLSEIVDTEAIYVEHLQQVIEGYLVYWRDHSNSLLTDFELRHLFNNIEDIFSFNSEFLHEIKDCQLEAILIANTFIKHNSGFKVYTEYCTNYPRAVSTLTNLMSRSETAKAFRERQEALGHALPLGSFLLKPVQRILKYHLLLENLSKEFEADEARENFAEGKIAIDEALKAMTGIAEHINAMKRRHEHAVRVQEIQSLLYGWTGADLTTSGELIAEGKFRMRGAKAPRHAFLFEKMLLLTKKKEDALLLYKTHIMCSNLMLIESIPGEPLSFHVIPFDNPRLQYTLQARNLEQKREWTLQIKRVMLENYNAVIPIHARQLVLQLGQTQHDDSVTNEKISVKKLYSSPPEYLERRKQEKDRRRSEARLRYKTKKSGKFDTDENNSFLVSSSSSTTLSSSSSSSFSRRDQNINRSTKVKDRLTNWRRKSEPGFQSYISLSQFDEEEQNKDKDEEVDEDSTKNLSADTSKDSVNFESSENYDLAADDSCREDIIKNNLCNIGHRDVNIQPQTVEQIVSRILMQNEEFQRLLEKQRNNSIANIRQQRFHKEQSNSMIIDTLIDTSDESDCCNENYSSPLSNDTNATNDKTDRLQRVAGGKNSEKSECRSVQPYHNNSNNNRLNGKASPPRRFYLNQDEKPAGSSYLQLQYNNFKDENDKSQKPTSDKAFKKHGILTESKIIKTALRMANEESKEDEAESKEFESPTRPSIWLTKLCEDLPIPHKSGSLPRSFETSSTLRENFPHEVNKVMTKTRFLQRDGKPFTERPFTIASDKPAEINLEDIERYNPSYQCDKRVDEGSTADLTSVSTFFCSLGSNSTVSVPDADKIHPDHKIYRNNLRSTILRNVLLKAGSRLQGLKLMLSTETLDSASDIIISDDIKCRRSCNYSSSKDKRVKSRLLRLPRELSLESDEFSSGCIPLSTSDPSIDAPPLYYKQGSSSLGARIAQADYADPSVLFGSYFESKRSKGESEVESDRKESDCFYEKSFETIENCDTLVHSDEGKIDEVFRDCAIICDTDEQILSAGQLPTSVDASLSKSKVPPPVPARASPNSAKSKPCVAAKPENLKLRTKVRRKNENNLQCIKLTLIPNKTESSESDVVSDAPDVSAGQSQAGWVKKMVGQLQAKIE